MYDVGVGLNTTYLPQSWASVIGQDLGLGRKGAECKHGNLLNNWRRAAGVANEVGRRTHVVRSSVSKSGRILGETLF